MTRNKLLALFTPAVIVIVLDQWSKWVIRTTPELHRFDIIEGWLMFYYTKNDGMALGIDIFDTYVVSLISITATIGIIAYILFTMKQSPVSYLVLMGLVIGGALGNIIDRLTMAYVGGYGGLLDGHVVDFIFFNLELFDRTVFPYIFNVADIAISVSIVSLLIFNKKFFPNDDEESATEEESPAAPVADAVPQSPETPDSEK
ncbi:MAG: signal peptidase II [Balneolaceae bacterium]|nr:signal peptidase II [Balneolaceae bacterium]